MKCRRVRQLLLDFVDGLGNEALHAEADRHLAECAECETFSAELTRSVALVRRTPVEPLDENFNWKVRLAIHREQKATAKGAASTGAWVRAWNFRYVASTGVAFAVVLAAGVAAVNNFAPSSPSSTTRGDRMATPSQSATTGGTVGRMTPTSPRVMSPRQEGMLVSDGSAGPVQSHPAVRGAIDRFAEENAIDSLIDARLNGLTPEMRDQMIQRQIHWLESQLERQAQLQRDSSAAPRR